MLANPQSGFLRPAFLFSLGFGCVIGQKLEIALMLLVGVLGMWFLAKHSGVSAQGRVISCALFCFSTYFTLKIGGGLVSFFQYFLLPTLFLCFLRGQKDRRFLYAGAGVLVLAILGGAPVHLLVPVTLFLLPCVRKKRLNWSSIRITRQAGAWKARVLQKMCAAC